MSFRIGSFNLKNISTKHLGKNNPRDIRKIAQIIQEEQLDIVALQEVLAEGTAICSPESKNVKRSLLMELGPRWDFRWAEAESKLDKRREGYAFLWRKDKFSLPVVELDNGTKRTFNPRICNIKNCLMNRKPFYGRFTTQDCIGGGNFEIRLICIHTYFSDKNQRKQEVENILTEVYPQIEDRVYKNNIPSYTFVIGDYNMELFRDWKPEAHKLHNDESPLYLDGGIESNKDIYYATHWNNKRIQTFQDQFTTLKKSGENEEDPKNIPEYKFSDRGYAHDYDHCSYDIDRFEKGGVKVCVKKIDAVRKYNNDDFENYYQTVSDHVPIVVELDLSN